MQKCQECVHICNIGIHIPICICHLSSEYRFISPFGCRSPRIFDKVSNFSRNGCVLECLPDNWIANNFIFGYNGCCIDLFHSKVKRFGRSSTGKFTSNFTIMGYQTCVFRYGITIFPEQCSCFIFPKTSPIKLNGGNAWKHKFYYGILNASIANAFSSECHDIYFGIW